MNFFKNRSIKITKAKIKIAKAIIDAEEETKNMKDGYGKTRELARLLKAKTDLPKLEDKLADLTGDRN